MREHAPHGTVGYEFPEGGDKQYKPWNPRQKGIWSATILAEETR